MLSPGPCPPDTTISTSGSVSYTHLDVYKQQALIASSIDDFRHKEVVPANFENIAQIDIVLEDVNYTISSKGAGDDRTYYYGDEELEIDELQSALQALSADSFTDEEPTQRRCL